MSKKSCCIAPYGVVLILLRIVVCGFETKEENNVEIEINFITTNKVLTEWTDGEKYRHFFALVFNKNYFCDQSKISFLKLSNNQKCLYVHWDFWAHLKNGGILYTILKRFVPNVI